MNEVKITLGIYEAPSQRSNLFKEIDGVSVSVVPPQIAFDCSPDIVRYVEYIVTIAAPAIPYAAKWLFDNCKKKEKNNGVVLNGNQITGDNNTVTQIINIIEGKPKG